MECLNCSGPQKSAMVVGIGGVTNGGKTSLCSKLCQHYKSNDVTVLNMDDFFHPDEHPAKTMLEEFNYANWDEVAAVDLEKMTRHVKQWKEKNRRVSEYQPILLVEGILIYNHEPLLSEMDLKYFLTLSKEECWERRSKRTYDPPEPPGYFEKICWPMYLKYKKEIMHYNDIVYLDGTANQEDTFQQVVKDIDNTHLSFQAV